MTDFTQIIRTKFPGQAIWYFFELSDRIVYFIGSSKTIKPADSEAFFVSVSKSDGSLEPFKMVNEYRSHKQEIDKAMTLATFIDATKEDTIRI